MELAPINLRSCYSLLKSLIKLEDYVAFGKSINSQVLTLCDDNMYGAYEFHQLCNKNNIKPIIGLNLNVNFNNNIFNIQLYAKNKDGYFSLVKISSLIMIQEESEQQSIDYVKIDKLLSNNLFAVLNFNTDNFSKEFFTTLNRVFHENLFLGLNYNNESLIADFENLVGEDKIVWNNKVLYFDEKDYYAFKLLKAINKQVLFDEIQIPNQYSINQLVKDEYEVYQNNIRNIINDIEVYDLKKGEVKSNLLQYPTPENISSREFLLGICKKGLEYRFGKNIKREYYDRLMYELDVINKMGFNDYFLIVWDYVHFAKTHNIYVGPGRGSAAGSLVSYLLNITAVDPIKYDLLFERFLNPERTSLPDIDIDFEDTKREQVVEYLFEKYGQEHVAHIVTYQTIGAKMAVRDLCRALDIPIAEANKISKAIRLEDNFDVINLFANNKMLNFYKDKYPHLFKYLPYFVGLPRQTGTHAAGVVLSQQPLSDVIPIRIGYNGIYQTQYSMNYLEDLGLLKMDLLGLRNLSILHDIVDSVKQENSNFDIDKIPLNDKKTFDLLTQGETDGIFQLESTGMRKVLMDMIPTSVEDIASTSSLYRPGPQDNIPYFIKRKHSKEKIEYIDNRLKDILEKTYGIIVYQEQVMLIAQRVANFSLAKSDILRRAMGKKDPEIMEKMRAEFIKSAIDNGYTENLAQQIWGLIFKFASYGFNRSHAICYSLLGYQMAYLKANYPSQFLASLLSSVIGDENKTFQYLTLAKKYRLKLVAPNVNKPLARYVTKQNEIYLPLLIIKQIGFAFYNKIYDEYSHNGVFKDIFDFFVRLYKKGLNKKTYEALCFTNALRDFKYNNLTLFNNYNIIVDYIELVKIKEDKEFIEVNLDLIEKPEIKYYDDDLIINLEKEYEFLGFYLSNHPLKYIREKEKLENLTTLIKDLKLEQNYANILVVVKKVKIINDKNNRKMAFLDCYDETGKISVTMFASSFENYQQYCRENNILLLNIKLNSYQSKITGVFNRLKLIQEG